MYDNLTQNDFYAAKGFGMWAKILSVLGLVSALFTGIIYCAEILGGAFVTLIALFALPSRLGLLFYDYVVYAMILSFVTAATSFVAIIVSIIAGKAGKNWSLASAVLSVACAAMMFACLSVPDMRAYAFSVTVAAFSGIFSLAAFVMYVLYWFRMPDFYRETNEETIMKDGVLKVKRTYSSKEKLQLLLAIGIPMLVFLVTVATVIPIKYDDNCEEVYDFAVGELSSAKPKDTQQIGYMSEICDILPDDYKDIARIKSQYEYYYECVNEYGESQTSEGKMAALKKMYKLKEADERWNFDSYNYDEALFCDAYWTDGEFYFLIRELDESPGFSTDLPKKTLEKSEEENIENEDVYMERQYGLLGNMFNAAPNSYVFGYRVVLSEGDNSRSIKNPCYRISNFRYSESGEEFLMNVYCFETNTTYIMSVA